MDEPWDPSLMTGDQCALCEAPLDEPAFELEDEDGSLLRVCASCALRRPLAAREEDEREGASRAPKLDQLRTWVEALLARREDEAVGLRDLVDALQRFHEDAEHWRAATTDLERRLRVVEGDLSRTRDRLRSAEELLGWTGGDQPAVSAETSQTTPPPSTARPAPGGEAVGRLSGDQEQHIRHHFPAQTPDLAVQATRFTVDELRQVQRFFNESVFTEKTRSVRRSLGTPVVNLMRVVGPGTRVLVTVAWDIVWYQYLVRLEEDPGDEDRVTLFAEGMELHELADNFLVSNAGMDDKGRIDASELEVELLTDQPLLTDMTAEEEAAFDDATEEVWDKHTMPEFRWDD